MLSAALFLAAASAAAQPGASGGVSPAAPGPAGQATPPPGAEAPSTTPPSGVPQPPAPIEQVTFDEAIRRALARNVSLVIAVDEVRRADGLLWQARSGSLPILILGGVYTRLDHDRLLNGRVIAAADQAASNIGLTVPLVVPSRWYQWAHAAQSLDATRAGEADVRRTTAITTARAYLTIIAQRRALDVIVRARENARAHYEFARARRAAGVGNALDELRADQLLGTTEAQVDQTYTALARAREALGVLTGSDRPLDAVQEPALGAPPFADPQSASRDAEGRREDVLAARARAYAAERVAKDSWADWLPSLVATVQPFYQYPPSLTTPQWGWQLLLTLTVPVFEGGLRIGQARERGALADEADAQLEAVLWQLHSDVRFSFDELRHAETAYASSERAADRAARALALATQAYRAGALTSLDVIDAERQARDAETAAIVAEDAVRQARLDLLAATGHFP